MQTKLLFLRRSLASFLLVLPTACHAVGQSAQAGRAVKPGLSQSGALLGALISIRRNDVATASKALMAATRSGAPEPLRELALLYALIDAKPEAARDVHRIATMQRNSPLAHFTLGTEEIAQGQWPGARAQFTPLMKGPHSVFNNLAASLVALTWYGQGERAKAVASLQESGRKPDDWLSRFLLMRVMAADNPSNPKLKPMFQAAARQIDAAPTVIQIWFIQFEAAWQNANEHRDKALSLLSRLRQRDASKIFAAGLTPEYLTLRPTGQEMAAEILMLYASALSEATSLAASGAQGPSIDPEALQLAKRYQSAVLGRALYLSPHLTLARLQLAQLQRDDAHLGDASVTLSAVTHDDPFYIAVALQKLDLALRREDTGAALNELKEVSAAFPKDVDFLTMRATLEMSLSQFGNALQHCNMALQRISPTDRRQGELLYCRGAAREKLGDRDAAGRDYNLALEHDPDNAGLLNNIGYGGILRQEAPEKSLALVRRAHELNPESSEANDSYGWGLMMVHGDVATALPLLTKAIEKHPDDPEIGYHLGVAYWYHGMEDEARTEWTRALDAKPDVATHDALTAALKGAPPPLGTRIITPHHAGRDARKSDPSKP